MAVSEADLIIDDIDAEYNLEVKRDKEVLHEMELASTNNRVWSNKPGTSIISDELRTITNMLPPIVRDSALDTYMAFSCMREHFDDVHELLLSEFRMLDVNRPALRTIGNDLFKKLPPKYRNNFSRSRTRLQERKVRIAVRIARTREKIAYLDRCILQHNGGVPPAPMPCALCYIEGTGTLVFPKTQPACSNIDCQFVTCADCFHKLKHAASIRDPVKCPGCRSPYKMKGLFVTCKKDMMDPFNVISDDESDDSNWEVADESEEEL